MKGLIIFSNGMEDNEALSTLSLLRRAGMVLDSATKEDNLKVKTAYGISVEADKHVDHLVLEDYQYLIIPGGGYVAKIIDKADYMFELIKHFSNHKKDIYAICAAPRFLGRLGLLDNLDFTAFPGSEKDALNGRYLKDELVVSTTNIITARSAGAVVDFVYEIIKKNKGENTAKWLLENLMYEVQQI